MKKVSRFLVSLMVCTTVVGSSSLLEAVRLPAGKKGVPPSLVTAIRQIYAPAGLVATHIQPEGEGCEYGACRFSLGDHHVVFRVAKTTPTKIGQFVTIWKRPRAGGPIAPLDVGDGIDFLIVKVSDGTHSGQFVFDKNVLIARGVMSASGKGGKRAIRVYPPWSQPVAREAVKTKEWQAPYFFPIAGDGTANPDRVRRLFD